MKVEFLDKKWRFRTVWLLVNFSFYFNQYFNFNESWDPNLTASARITLTVLSLTLIPTPLTATALCFSASTCAIAATLDVREASSVSSGFCYGTGFSTAISRIPFSVFVIAPSPPTSRRWLSLHDCSNDNQCKGQDNGSCSHGSFGKSIIFCNKI